MPKIKTSINDISRQILNVIFAITQIFTGYFLTILGVGNSIGSQSASNQTPVIPAPYAFSIWGFIFFFCLLYCVYQALPGKRQNELLRSIGWFTAGAFFFNTVWITVAQLISFNWPTAIIIVLILACSLGALYRLTKYKKSLTTTEKWIVKIPISVLAGWVTMATFVNFSSVLYQLNFGNFGLSTNAFAILLISIAVLFAGFIFYKTKRNILYGLAILWALIAILVANFT